MAFQGTRDQMLNYFIFLFNSKWANVVNAATYLIFQASKSEPLPVDIPEEKETAETHPHVNGNIVENGIGKDGNLVNGVYDDAEDIENETAMQDNARTEVVDAKKTEIIFETVITEGTETSTETEPISNGDNVLNLSSNEAIESPATSPTKSNKAMSSNSLNVLSDNDATTDATNEEGAKPAAKVKKQKSFKKALMKKFNKKEEHKKDDTK